MKEEEALAREAGAYVNAHGDLLTELMKRYAEEDFSWMEDLFSRAKEDSEEEPERERGNDETENVPEEQVRGDPSVE